MLSYTPDMAGAVPSPWRFATTPSLCPIASAIRIAREKWNAESATPSKRLKGKRFESLAEGQAYLDHWEERWADTRIHGTTKRQVSIMFAEEKPVLQPLPLEPFRYYQYGDRSVHLDGCVEVEAAYYSAPPGSISRRVRVQWTAFMCVCWTPNRSATARASTPGAR